jgi:hypothetical protein
MLHMQRISSQVSYSETVEAEDPISPHLQDGRTALPRDAAEMLLYRTVRTLSLSQNIRESCQGEGSLAVTLTVAVQ